MSTKRNRNLPQQLTLDHVSPATRLLEKRRQMFEVQEALDAQKEEFQRREATFKRREEMLKKKDLALQESLIRFNKFLQENDSKRNRAEKKRADEAKQKTGKEAEIERLVKEVEKQKQKRGEMETEVRKMSRYQAYLDFVLEMEEDWPEIADLLSRYATLDAANKDLIERQDTASQENEDERHFLQQFIREKTDVILACNNKIADLQQSSEKTQAMARDLVSESDRQMTSVADSTLELGQVVMACENIYSRCLSHSKVARKAVKGKGEGNTDDTAIIIEKLAYMQDYLTDLQSISKLARPRDTQTPKGADGTGGPAPAPSGQKFSSQAGSESKERGSVRMSVGGGSESQTRGTGVSASRHSMSTNSDSQGPR